MVTSVIDELYIYPIKSLPGLSVDELNFGSLGVENDREFVLVNAQGRFISQRSHPALAAFHLSDNHSTWQVSSLNKNCIEIPKQSYTDKAMAISVWKDQATAYEVDPLISRWFSELLDETVHLVRFDELSSRKVEKGGFQGHFAFADGFPLLVCNSNSLSEINQNAPSDLSMQRFRPNIVLAMPENEEYKARSISFAKGGELKLVEPCVRCNIPAINPETTVFEKPIHEYLKAAINRGGKPVFGMNAIIHQLRTIRKGEQCIIE
ncbi:MOSC N-terminal beta barrel domain-containing protein [Reinekea marina]|uniref:MOSC domain-containing protein n=1 Tax=Reinekea marina TaxID=1310421 RepID=A0ABV7WMA3_9GAMM|nr:MOSC N-terminal beta barrel domain-containing protein [Reinekea marina]MDN3649390.1 MOSC N-terminal beta barrel domain-containing protein [Reinekea marina]